MDWCRVGAQETQINELKVQLQKANQLHEAVMVRSEYCVGHGQVRIMFWSWSG